MNSLNDLNTTNSLNTINSLNTTNSLNINNSLNTTNSLNINNSLNTNNCYIDNENIDNCEYSPSLIEMINDNSNHVIIDDNEIPEYSNSVLEEYIENIDKNNMYELHGFFNDIKISCYNPTANDLVKFLKNEKQKYFCIRSRKMLYKSPKHGIIGIDRGHVFNENPNNMTIGYVNYERYYGINNN